MLHNLEEPQISRAMRECIEICSRCHAVCTETLMHCLAVGADHAAADHIGTLLDCTELCDASRSFMLRGSGLNMELRAACARACDRCADSCERLDIDDHITRNCADVCRLCAHCCRLIAG
jgi:hypothetical protein